MHLSAGQTGANKSETGHHLGIRVELRTMRKHEERQRGFTLVELITVMVIIGILAVAALPRFFERSAFESRAFYDQVLSTLRYAQKAAIAQRRFVCVAFGAGDISLSHGTTAGCTAGGLAGPAGQAPYSITAPSGVILSGGVSFSFDALGVPSAPQIITVSPYPTPVIVEAGTGYVH